MVQWARMYHAKKKKVEILDFYLLFGLSGFEECKKLTFLAV